MKPWMLALVAAKRELVSPPPYTSSQSVTIPFGVSRLETASGYGARGANGAYVQRYNRTSTIYAQRRSDGFVETIQGAADTLFGPKPADYCGPVLETPDDPVYASNQTCYAFYDASYTEPNTTGASATGFGLTFPGSTGDVAQTPVSFSNVAVSGGASYALNIPSGGSITITYYK